MSGEHIKGILLQEAYITRRSLEVIVDLFYTSAITVVAFGFVSRFLVGVTNPHTGSYLILGLLLWEVIRVNQYSLSVGSLWNIWSHNLSNMFVAPLSVTEYIVAHMLSALLKTLVTFCGICMIAAWGFHFDVLQMGVANLMLFFANLTVFAWSVGLVLLGVIFQIGPRIQALAWGTVFLFQPLTAAFFPLSALPPAVRAVAYALPPTFVFEAARGALGVPGTNWLYVGIAAAENVVYFALAASAFAWMLARSRASGRLARAEG